MLHAVHVRGTHVHVVVSALSDPDPVLEALKGYASRSLNRCGTDIQRSKQWTRGGSAVYLWTEDELVRAIRYVVDSQGPPMEVFEG